MSLEVSIVNAVNLPNLESIGKIDPYVSVTVLGVSKKTAVIKSELNPTWNETLKFDLEGRSIQEKDEVKLLIKDWERVGRNRLIGTASVLMREVLKSGLGTACKLVLNLVDGNQRPVGATLILSILYTPPPDADPRLQLQTSGREITLPDDDDAEETGGKDADTGEGGGGGGGGGAGKVGAGGSKKKKISAQKSRSSLSSKEQDFQLRIKVIEGRQLPGCNISPICRIRCCDQTQQTRIQRSTNAPYWNEIFFFNFFKSPASLFDELITFQVYNSQQLRSDSFIGSFKCDVGMVFDEPQHSFINKWLLLCDPDDTIAGGKGYLKICATLLGAGDDAPSFGPSKVDDDEDIEGNLLRPSGVLLRPATFKLKLYCAEELPRMDSNVLQSVKEVFGTSEKKELVDPYFIFSFAGRQIKSKILYNCDHPEWNQELRIGLQFPSMCDKIKLQVVDWDRFTGHDSIGVYNLPTANISRLGGDVQSSEEGFLPTFGPCFVNLYGAPREFSEIPSDIDVLNLGKGEGVAFRGRVLVELQTLIGELPATPVEDILSDDIVRVQKFMRRRRYKLNTAFLNASMISAIDTPIEFEVSIGNYGNTLDDNMPPCVSTSQPTNAVFDGCFYYYLPWDDRKPCVCIDCHWEDISFRLEALNLILAITERLEENLAKVNQARISKMADPDISDLLTTLLAQLSIDCKKPLPDIIEGVHVPNDLDLNLRSYRKGELSRIAQETSALRSSVTDITSTLSEIDGHLNMLKSLCFEPQNSMPDVLIWMISGEKRIAYCRIPAYQVLWSPNPDYCGKMCGKLETIALKYPGSKAEKENRWEIPALLRVRLWLGLAMHEKEWLHLQSEGSIAVFAETYENQVSMLGKWMNKGPAMSRPKWSDPAGKVELAKESFQPPHGWKWESDWYISPELSMLYDKDAGHTQFMDDIYECQSRLPGTNWGASSTPWTDVKGDAVTARNDMELPAGWEWQDDWQIDLNRAVDEYGFEYTVEATMGGYGAVEKNYHMCRRRRWVRMRKLVKSVSVHKEKAKKDVLAAEGWEYAPIFTMKFHHVERKMDLVRRRRWLRKMVTDPDYSGDGSAPLVFQIASSELKDKKDDDDMAMPVTTAPRMFLVCEKPHQYQLRAYIYQGRDLLASDSNGLSDPYTRVTFMNQSQVTERLDKTICPTWDQTLIFTSVDIHGDPKCVLTNPPEIVLEIFDYDTFGSAEFMGRTIASPTVKLDASSHLQPSLKWYKVMKGTQPGGELLLAFELLLIKEEALMFKPVTELMDGKELPFQPPKRGKLFMVPSGIRPVMVRTAIEAMCWGVRNMKRYQFINVTSPSVELEVGGQLVSTKVIRNTNRNPNFEDPVLFFDIMLPREELYTPPLNIFVRDNRPFGRKPLVGVHAVSSLARFRCPVPTLVDDDESKVPLPTDGLQPHVVDIPAEPTQQEQQELMMISAVSKLKFGLAKSKEEKPEEQKTATSEDIDWWSKFYSCTGQMDKCKQYLELGYDRIQILDTELEKVSDYGGFTDFCDTFPLSRGKNVQDEESVVGDFKGTFRVYPLPGDPSELLPPRALKHLPQSGPVECIVRVYIIQAFDLQPHDPNGLSDPYIQIKLGKTRMDNRNEYIPNTLNPVFGRMFELKALIPLDTDLHVRIKDFDLLTSDDVIGETVIDLENRLLTRHRATVGLPQTYCTGGVTAWRDSRTPKVLLDEFCSQHCSSQPVYSGNTVKIGARTYNLHDFENAPVKHPYLGEATERLALYVLHFLPRALKVPLVPEHIETRPLYSLLQPGIAQGKIQLWVDMFPTSLGPPGPPFDIKQRKAKKYELRVIIWNTKDVILDEKSITGEMMSDIYVKGWINGIDSKQETDVHYRSMDGEGNFNWRFLFPFDYIPAEECIVVKKKEHFWSLDETESRLPPALIIQIWDNDLISADDFLGSVELNLNALPQPSKTAEKCSLKQLPGVIGQNGGSSKDMKLISIFDQKKMKGFWPCFAEPSPGNRQLTGKVEMEIELLTEQEALERPTAKARDEPNQHPILEPPNRPATSFGWFSSPFKTCKTIICRRYRMYCITGLIIFLLFLFLALFLYSVPEVVAKKIFGVS